MGVNAACHQNDVVMYEVVGTATAVDIQVTDPSGGTDKYEDQGLPWRFSYEGFENNQAYIYAHNNTEDGGITVNIYVNGQLVRTATSTGPYQTAVTYWDK
jgi:hypothetical protein